MLFFIERFLHSVLPLEDHFLEVRNFMNIPTLMWPYIMSTLYS